MRFLVFFICASCFVACSRSSTKSNNNKSNLASLSGQPQVEADVRFLASDALRGRDTGSDELKIASDYISKTFKEIGLKTLPNGTYKQSIPLEFVEPPVKAIFSVADLTLVLKEDLLLINGSTGALGGAVVYVGYGGEKEIEGIELKDKIVITNAGSEDASDPRAFYQMALEKQARFEALGATALIELYRSPKAPWSQVYKALGAVGLRLKNNSGSTLPLVWANDPKGTYLQKIIGSTGTAATLEIEQGNRYDVEAENVIGHLPGTDPSLAKEYIIVSAHYDHIGVSTRPGAQDSIFNGARDNGLGVAAMLHTAKKMADAPSKRPMLFVAWTAEEKGLLGSKYFVREPVVPLEQVAFNLNMDGAGYTDTSMVIMNGYGRTTAQTEIDQAINAVGTKATPDPVPEMNLYHYSDNWSFAVRGVPAINLAPGFTGFTPELMKYYHQPEDSADGLDFEYVYRYARAAEAAAKALGNTTSALRWVEGDELAEKAKDLYNR